MEMMNANEIRNSCACLQARRRARMLTRAYDEILAPSGIKITQLGLLSCLLEEPVLIGALADELDLDRTTLTRNLVPLEKQGLIAIVVGKDARSRSVSITTNGKLALKRALPLWQKAQDQYSQSEKKRRN
jgi:DNA-binding MarR family transcriptional regulator